MLNIKTTVTGTVFSVIAALSSAAALAAATITQFPITPGMPAPFPRCPQHETLLLQSGYLQLLLNDRTDKSGGRHITIRQQLIGVTAIGETTGAEYRMVGNVAYLPGFPQATTINDPDPFGTTQLVFHQTLSIQAVPVGGSEADRISIHVLTQATWNANGELAAEVADVNATCDG